jgi:hypothetical protein
MHSSVQHYGMTWENTEMDIIVDALT